jgi:hypothetical protein
MEARLKVDALAHAYAAHERICRGYLVISVPTPDLDERPALEFTCSRCAQRFTDTFTQDEALQLKQAGIITDLDFRRIVAQAETQSIIVSVIVSMVVLTDAAAFREC